MSNRRLTPNHSKTNRRRLSTQTRTIIAAILLSGGMLTPGMIARANSPAPGTIIENQATGSFVDPSDSSTQLIESNVVQVEVAEVAGITVAGKGYTEPNDGTVNDGETVYADFVITNVGNDPTQFVIPGTAAVTNGTQTGSIQIIEYDADGPGAGAPEDLSGSNITVPGGGDNTSNLLNGVPNTNNGSIPVGGSITVRVPVTAGNAGDDLTVVLGDTALANGQNEAYVAGTNDVYTQDNSGTDNGDTAGAPVNGEREASNSLTVQIATASNPNQTIDATPSATACTVQGGTLSGVNLFTPLDNGTMGFENGDPDQSPATNPYPGIVTGGNFVQYTSAGTPGHGDYAYIANMQNARNNFQHEGITDPVYGNTGRFFVSDPDNDTPTMTVTLTGLTPNQFYEYSFWAANAEPSGPSSNNIDILIDGETVYSTGDLPFVPALAWKKHTFTFTNGPGNSIIIDLKSTKTGSGGNDFNLDNIELQECNFAIDYGDAPSSYGDALHTTIPLTPTVYLGATSPDSELATPVGTANGDDNTGDDEDAFTTLPDIPTTGTYDLTNIPVINTSGSTATLHAWIDFNQDGKFSTSEYQSTTVASGISTANLSWTVPGGVTSGSTYARFRITQNELIEDNVATTDVDERSQDAVINGEVEDYRVAFETNVIIPPPPTSCTFDGNIWYNDPSNLYTYNVFSNTNALQTSLTRIYGDIGWGIDGKLYGVDFIGGSASLYEVDAAIGTDTLLSNSTVANIASGNSLSGDEFGWLYFGSGAINAPTDSHVYRYNIYTAAASELWIDFEDHGFTGYPAGDFIFIDDVAYVAWNEPSISATNQLLRIGPLGTNHEEIPATTVTVLGTLPTNSWGIAGNDEGNLYAVSGGANELYKITLSPFSTTLVGSLSASPYGATGLFEAVGTSCSNPSSSNPNVLLVKRITQINNDTVSVGGDDLSGYINQDDATNPYDDNDITVAEPVDPGDPPKDTDQWPDPNTNLIGGIDGGNVMPNDEIEYTIYYLSSGDATAESVLFCDYVPTFTSFIPNGYTGSTPQASGGIGGADLSIELYRDGSTDYHTGANDGDSATYFGPGIDPANSFPDIDCDGDGNGTNANPNGAVVVNLGDLPDATSDATGAYGYVRFRTRVK